MDVRRLLSAGSLLGTGKVSSPLERLPDRNGLLGGHAPGELA